MHPTTVSALARRRCGTAKITCTQFGNSVRLVSGRSGRSERSRHDSVLLRLAAWLVPSRRSGVAARKYDGSRDILVRPDNQFGLNRKPRVTKPTRDRAGPTMVSINVD